jgi:hypothetical protein
VKALVLGGALSWRDDAVAALRLFTPDRVYAANHVMVLWPGRLDFACTMHPDELHVWMADRERLGRNTDYQTVTFSFADRRKRPARIDRYHDWMWPGQRNSGSSGLFATKVAIDDGATHVVLAGIPIDEDGSHIVRPGPWKPAESYQETWTGIAHHLTRVRSMSGWSSTLLGKPTAEWIATIPADAADADRRTGPDGP